MGGTGRHLPGTKPSTARRHNSLRLDHPDAVLLAEKLCVITSDDAREMIEIVAVQTAASAGQAATHLIPSPPGSRAPKKSRLRGSRSEPDQFLAVLQAISFRRGRMDDTAPLAPPAFKAPAIL